VVQHLSNPDDLILNTAQMRDAIHVQKFRAPSVVPNERVTIQQSVARAIDRRKPAAEGSSSAGRGRGRGRGRGAGAGRGSGQVGAAASVASGEGSIIHGRGQGPGQGRGGGRGRGSGRGHGHGAASPGEMVLDFRVPGQI